MNKKQEIIIFAGMPKTGSTSLYNSLKNHHKYSLPLIKEPHFFCSDFWDNGDGFTYPCKSYEEYEKLFSKKGIKLDLSTNYIFSKNFASDLLKSNYKILKVIIIIRDLEEWVQSWHQQCITTEGQKEQDISIAYSNKQQSILRPNSYLDYKNRIKLVDHLKRLEPLGSLVTIYGYNGFWKDKIYVNIFRNIDEALFKVKKNKRKTIRYHKIYIMIQYLNHKLKLIPFYVTLTKSISHYLKKIFYYEENKKLSLSDEIIDDCKKNTELLHEYLSSHPKFNVDKSALKELKNDT